MSNPGTNCVIKKKIISQNLQDMRQTAAAAAAVSSDSSTSDIDDADTIKSDIISILTADDFLVAIIPIHGTITVIKYKYN